MQEHASDFVRIGQGALAANMIKLVQGTMRMVRAASSSDKVDVSSARPARATAA